MCSLFIFAPKGTSQINPDVLTYSKGKFYYKNHFYKKKEADKLFMLNEEAFDYYKKYKTARSVTTVTGFGSIVLVAGGIILMESDGCESDLCGIGNIGLFSFLLGIPVAAVSVVSIPITRTRFNKSKETLNEALVKSNKVGIIPIEMKLGFSNNGVGVLFSF